MPNLGSMERGENGVTRSSAAVEGNEETVDGESHPQGDENVGDVEARVEVGADGGGEGERGVEAGAVGG